MFGINYLEPNIRKNAQSLNLVTNEREHQGRVTCKEINPGIN